MKVHVVQFCSDTSYFLFVIFVENLDNTVNSWKFGSIIFKFHKDFKR